MSTDYRCTTCGSGLVTVSMARPSLDDRYVLGTCGSCHASRTLVRSDVYAHQTEAITREQVRKDRSDAAKAVVDPKHKGRRKFTPERAAIGKQVINEVLR